METCIIKTNNYTLKFVTGIRFDTMLGNETMAMFVYWANDIDKESGYWSVTNDATGMKWCELPRQAIPGDDFLIAIAIIKTQEMIAQLGIARILSRLREVQTVKEDDVESN